MTGQVLNSDNSLTIIRNSDGSAMINFPGGGSHKVSGGPNGPIQALRDVYEQRLSKKSFSEELESITTPAHHNSAQASSTDNTDINPSENASQQSETALSHVDLKKSEETNDINPELQAVESLNSYANLTLEVTGAESAEINFPGGGSHIAKGGPDGPIQALLQVYGSRIATIKYLNMISDT